MKNEKLETHFNSLYQIEKESIQLKVNIDKNVHLIREDLAMHLQYRKKNGGDLDLAKISKQVLMLVIEIYYKLRKDNKLEENIEKFDIYHKAIKDKSIKVEEIDRLIENKRLKDEIKPTKKSILDDIKNDIGDEDALALEQLIAIVINNEKEIMEETMNKELGIEKNKPPKSEKGVLYERVKEIAKELNIKIKQ